MRTNLLFSAMAFAALAFAGCSKDDTFSVPPTANRAIGFGTYVGRDAVSRASVATEISVQQNHFGVFAFYTKANDFYDSSNAASSYTVPNFMDNEKVFWLGSQWDYRPGKYWPNDPNEKLSFFAYSPYDSTLGYKNLDGTNKKGNTDILFAVNQNIGQQVDLLYATEVDQTFNTTTNKSGIVKFNFKHALSRISLAVKCDKLWKDATLSIKKVILAGEAHTDGTDGSVIVPTAGAFYKKGYLDIISKKDEISWNPPADTEIDGKYAFTWNFATPPILNQKTTSTVDLTKADEYLMVIPQSFSEDNPLYVYVEYEVKTPLIVEDATEESSTEMVTTLCHASTRVAIDLQSGKAYKLILNPNLNWVDCRFGEIGEWDETPADTEIAVPHPQTTPAAGA